MTSLAGEVQAVVWGLFSTLACDTLRTSNGHMTIDFKNLIAERHKVPFALTLEGGDAALKAFLEIQTILARHEIAAHEQPIAIPSAHP